MQLSEPENLGSELHDSRAQATDRQRQSHRQTYVYILLLTNYLPHFRLHFYANPVGDISFSGFFLHIPKCISHWPFCRTRILKLTKRCVFYNR